MPTILTTASELQSLQAREPHMALLDVRLPEDYAEAHLPGARHQCVFEVVFLKGLADQGLKPEQPICVYGAAADSHESAVAVEKLERAGYRRVYDFRGGIELWRASGNALEHTSPADAPIHLPDGRHELDLKESKVEWLGRNLLSKHWGQVALKSGWVETRNDLPIRGEAILDMHRITSTDLAGHELHDILIRHLESDDFFDVERFPEAHFSFDQAQLSTTSPGCHNLRVHGILTLRGVSKSLDIDAAAGLTPDGRAALQATVVLDRTEWGSIYGSGRFFRRLLGHLVNDHVEIQLRLVTALVCKPGN